MSGCSGFQESLNILSGCYQKCLDIDLQQATQTEFLQIVPLLSLTEHRFIPGIYMMDVPGILKRRFCGMGGEAQAAHDAFKAMSAAGRDALIAFLKSL